ncbi:hypothetical protein Tco_0251014 [Tanacetum coccineum]
MAYRIHFRWSIDISSWVASTVVLQFWTYPLKMSLGTTFIARRLLTCPSAPLVVSSVGISRTPAITGQMANSIALVAFGSTRTIMRVETASPEAYDGVLNRSFMDGVLTKGDQLCQEGPYSAVKSKSMEKYPNSQSKSMEKP